MKKLLFLAIMAIMTMTSAFAQDDMLQFTSSSTGITCLVPPNVEITADEVEAVVLATPDNEFTFVAEAFNVEKATEDEMAEKLSEWAGHAGLDFDKSERFTNEYGLVTVTGFSMDYESGGGAAIVAFAVVNNTELGWYVTIVAGNKYTDYAASTITSINFDPDAVED